MIDLVATPVTADRPLVVIGAGSSWDGTRLADRHVAEVLSARVDVLYVDPPISFRSARNDPRLAGSAAEPPLRRIGEHLWRLTPRVPPRHRYPGLQAVATHLIRRSLREAVASIDAHDIATLSTTPDLFGAVPGKNVYWARDDYSAGGDLMGMSPWLLRRRERDAARRCDAVIAVTPLLVERWRANGRPAHLIPNGVDPNRFEAPQQPPADIPPVEPKVGFSGTLSARIDFELLHAVVDDGLELILVGWPHRMMPKAEIDRLLERPEVHWLGGKSYEELPAYMQAMDVGLLPYTDSDFNRASFPLKTLEYLSAGVPVVATGLPAMHFLDTDLVTIADSATFAESVRTQAKLRHDEALVLRRRQFAATNSWQQRVDEIAEVLGV